MRVGGRGREAEGDEKIIPVSLHKPAKLPCHHYKLEDENKTTVFWLTQLGQFTSAVQDMPAIKYIDKCHLGRLQ